MQTKEVDEHSLDVHPLKEMMGRDEWDKLRLSVQHCKISWPICVQVERPNQSFPSASEGG